MAGASAEGEVNHWPAFVDVLTTVIMVVTFMLVIMSAAIMVLSQRAVASFKQQLAAQQQLNSQKSDQSELGKGQQLSDSRAGATQGKGKDTMKSPLEAEDGTSVAELGSVLRSDPINGSDRMTIRTRETPDTLKLTVKAMEEPKDSTGAVVKSSDMLLKVDFEPLAVRYSDDNTKQMNDFLKSHVQPGQTYEIWSLAPETNSVSEAQRIAFFRAAMTRNILIKAGIPASSIKTQIRVTDPASKEGHTVRIVLKP